MRELPPRVQVISDPHIQNGTITSAYASINQGRDVLKGIGDSMPVDEFVIDDQTTTYSAWMYNAMYNMQNENTMIRSMKVTSSSKWK